MRKKYPEIVNDIKKLGVSLLENPELGKTEPGTDGVKKVRMSITGKSGGKSGGARVYYYYIIAKK